jgi:hypothetical protein
MVANSQSNLQILPFNAQHQNLRRLSRNFPPNLHLPKQWKNISVLFFKMNRFWDTVVVFFDHLSFAGNFLLKHKIPNFFRGKNIYWDIFVYIPVWHVRRNKNQTIVISILFFFDSLSKKLPLKPKWSKNTILLYKPLKNPFYRRKNSDPDLQS